MNEKNIGLIRRALDRSSAGINQNALAKLRGARERALAHYDARQKAPVFAWAGVGGQSHADGSRRSVFYWLAALLLAASLFGVSSYWQSVQEHEIAEVDMAILTDDMPMDVYVD